MKSKPIDHIKDLVHDPKNARKHTSRNVGTIVSALHEVGAARSIVIDEDGVVLAGNATMDAAAEAGITAVKVVEASGHELVAVRRTGLTPEQKTRLALYDNRAAELAEWDAAVLEQLARDNQLDGLFNADELQELLGDLAPAQALGDPDAAPEPPADPITKPGDLWLLGDHRLLCGDSTKAEDVGRCLGGVVPVLMVTDPPYGVEYDADWRNHALRSDGSPDGGRAVGKVANDDRADWSEAWRLFPGDVAYVWHAGNMAHVVAESLIGCDLHIRAQIIWAKNQLVIGRGDYHPQHEPCWYCVRKGKPGLRTDDRKQTTLWQIDKPHKSETGHSTQKPVECMARPMRNHAATLVYDPFLGSGTTLIAAEQLGRKCYGMEISPQYCDVIVQRWETYTGKTATREGASA